MKNNNVKLLTMMTSIIFMMTAGPAAFGQATPETHNADIIPTGTNPAGTLWQWAGTNNVNPPCTVGQTGSCLFDIIMTQIFIMYAPPGVLFANVDVSTVETCAAAVPSLPGQIKYVLYHNSAGVLTIVTGKHIDVGFNTPGTIFFDSIDVNDVPLIAPKNTVDPAGLGDGFGGGSPATAQAGLQPGGTLTPALAGGDFYVWHRTMADGKTPIPAIDDTAATAAAGALFAVSCAFLDNDSTAGENIPGTFQAQTDGSNNIEASVFIESTVGGVPMLIGGTSLLVAGVQSNALWILSILGLAGTIIAIRKLQA